ncbi:hypothetical protein B0H19DRAFT_1055542 [Mycena capillaripes]|nr:hypothetical protein B0H19DRAFT_1055542 [Mycena capillaripes]
MRGCLHSACGGPLCDRPASRSTRYSGIKLDICEDLRLVSGRFLSTKAAIRGPRLLEARKGMFKTEEGFSAVARRLSSSCDGEQKRVARVGVGEVKAWAEEVKKGKKDAPWATARQQSPVALMRAAGLKALMSNSHTVLQFSGPFISDLHFEKTTKYIFELWNDLTEGDASTPDTNKARKIWVCSTADSFVAVLAVGAALLDVIGADTIRASCEFGNHYSLSVDGESEGESEIGEEELHFDRINENLLGVNLW